MYRSWTPSTVVVAPNGAERRTRSQLHGILPETLRAWWRYLLFVASAHPPNGAGFVELVLGGVARLRPNERVVVAGSVCSLIEEHFRDNDSATLGRDRLVLLGEVSPFTLDCLIENATGMLLPITYGGGSNLKTAEALLAGRPIVATAKAFRGCEAFTDTPGVIIAETEEAFSAAMRRVLSGDVPSPPKDERLGSIVWDQTLQPIVNLVREVAAGYHSPNCVQLLSGTNHHARLVTGEGSSKLPTNLPRRGDVRDTSNDDLLALVDPWSGQVPRGYIPTFTGAMVAVPFWAHWLSTVRIAEVLEAPQRFKSTRRPTFGDGEYYFEQANIIRSVVDAKKRYVMVELGGGNGPRAVDAALILRKLKPEIRPFLVVVEAIPTYVHWCRHHFAVNGLNADEHWLLNGIVSAEPIPALFFLQPRGFGNQMADKSVIDMLSSVLRDRASAIDVLDRLGQGGVSIKDGAVTSEPPRRPMELGDPDTWATKSVRKSGYADKHWWYRICKRISTS